MCGRYVLVQSIEAIEKRFNITLPIDFDWSPNYNISPGQNAPVITSENPKELQIFRFGLIPHWSKKKMCLFNARAEGDRNQDNNFQYNGSKDIINKPAFRKAIRSQRCLVLADAFIEGTTDEGLSKPYIIYLRNKERPFAFAGIYDKWLDEETGEIVSSFSIITTVSNELMRKIPHHRSPVILPKRSEQTWLNLKTPLSDITKLLNPYPTELMNGYEISNEIKNPKNNFKELINPLSEPFYSELAIKTKQELKLQGMGSKKNYVDQNWDKKNNPT